MSSVAPITWAIAHEEDRRFRAILLQTMALSLVLSVAIPYIRIPIPEVDLETELPPRRVQLLSERPGPTSNPTSVSTPLQQSASAAEKPARETISKPATESRPVAPPVTPRQKAASSGVLAMTDALEELRTAVPNTDARPVLEDAGMEVHKAPDQSSLLTINVNRGSGGISGGVDHQSVLGEASLPAREQRQPGAGLSQAGEVGGDSPYTSPGAVRREDEVQELLDRNKGAMYTLYNRELRKNDSLQGKLVLSITIAPTGRVTRCVILSSELGSNSLEQQLVTLIERIDFGSKPGAAAVTTRIPIEFFPR